MTLFLLFAIAMIVQMTVGRTQLIASRGYLPASGGIVSGLLTIASGLSFFALTIWGFASLPWYYVIGVMFVAIMAGTFIVGRSHFAFWYSVRSIVDFMAVALTGFLWLKYWPF